MRRNVPKGLNDRSQAIYCLGVRKRRSRPVGQGVIRRLWTYRLAGGRKKPVPRIIPYPLRDSHDFVTIDVSNATFAIW